MTLIEFLSSQKGEIVEQLLEHLYLTFLSLLVATVTGILLGVAILPKKRVAALVIGLTSVFQTIPSIALLGFFIPLMGIGKLPAIVALIIYALLPIVRNTYTGITEVSKSIIEAARGMGLSKSQILLNVQLPLALPFIFAGVRTAAVINVGVATLAAYIGAGGLGQYIFRGIAMNNTNMLLAGAIPAALLAVLIDAALGFTQSKLFYQR